MAFTNTGRAHEAVRKTRHRHGMQCGGLSSRDAGKVRSTLTAGCRAGKGVGSRGAGDRGGRASGAVAASRAPVEGVVV